MKEMSPSVITELICLTSEIIDYVAHCFAKHGVELCLKFCLQFLSNREAARLSWKCVNVFTDTSGNDEKAGNLQEKLLKTARVPYGKKIETDTMTLKGKSFLEEDISNTCL